MIYVYDELLLSFPIVSFVLQLFFFIRKLFFMAVGCNSPRLSSPSSSSSSSSSSSPLPWKNFQSPIFSPKTISPLCGASKVDAAPSFQQENSFPNMYLRESSHRRRHNSFTDGLIPTADDCPREDFHGREMPQVDLRSRMQELIPNRHLEESTSGSSYDACLQVKSPDAILVSEGVNSLPNIKIGEGNNNASRLIRKRPARIIIPESFKVSDFGEAGGGRGNKEFELQGRGFFLASKRGRRETMEDGYAAMTDILRDPKQAFFGVFDGHGGRAAVDYVAENLGKNIVKALEQIERTEDLLERAIREGYLTTDKEFIGKGVSSGACAATVFLKDGELFTANVGDCRVVLSRKGVADALTHDHRLNREDERCRIESSGGYVTCRHGVWRAQGSLAVSRAFGDMHLKDWIISDPEIRKLCLTPDCEFLIMASDGLWDKVTNQEAVDVLLKNKISIESCKKLVDLSSSRGNKDDTTVMVVDLSKF
ncbi:PREDICTED: probable protein phosphatase 2C 74 [Nelumbo nucifera]|uniref:protein-serine/threonine phosphatase n=1 Tax=Nelumbo nucifera TaxID=4432 RepID=A0A1U8BF21_NELNU|nr:PREDICTED: probable protein phosphatase 2C 74 [Nelumbo nucifera]